MHLLKVATTMEKKCIVDSYNFVVCISLTSLPLLTVIISNMNLFPAKSGKAAPSKKVLKVSHNSGYVVDDEAIMKVSSSESHHFVVLDLH